MEIILAEIKDGGVVRFPYGEVDLFADNPNTNFKYATVFDNYQGTERNLQGFELVRVMKLPAPPVDISVKVCEAGAPIRVGDEWHVSWTVRDKTPSEVQIAAENQAADIRAERNRRLAASDWTQVADAPGDKAAWATHRQALRDITSQAGFPWTVNWPAQPE